MEQKVTLKELAKQLNVSISTVSKALNDSPEISPRTRERIKEAAQLRHYIPSSLGRNLKSMQTRTIGVIIPDILPHFFAKALYGMEAKATEMGYRLIICISNESLKKEKESIETLISGSVDGIVMSISQETQAKKQIQHLLDLKEYNVPLVLFDRVLAGIPCDKVSINDSLQAEQATMELISTGCRKVAYATGIPFTSVDDQRRDGYMEAAKRQKMKNRIIEFTHDKFPHQKFLKLLQEEKIDGILASDELSAVQVTKCILNAGFRIPEDISVIGFTNGVMGENFRPSLSVIDQQEEEQGKLALETAIDRIENKLPDEFMDYKLKTTIIHRDSTRKV
ncbi:LacI family transcriptional regulator [Christiangramia fulva]|uniref:LacI family transcriptional regulator n=1 Tax=Christiangramia fulva TaxID=2126553 RepID=A0A2R3Z9R2_9FLAO|nr:LacI family DNA-binding transcriptional regulator [Christiangramia fulva]AVR46999.1 LacI family transcriptional regulator [Christiangramia fulva]